MSISLTEANWCPQATTMLHNGKEISKEKQIKLKALYLEGMLHFLDIYSQTEIGDNIEIDIMKVALYINSAQFENEELYCFKDINDIYKLCEELTLQGLPLWRFLILTDYQKQLFETDYEKLLIQTKIEIGKKLPCYRCIWFNEENTSFGQIRQCTMPDIEFRMYRKGYCDPEGALQKKCKWVTTLDKIPEALNKNYISKIKKEHFLRNIEFKREQFKKNLLKDTFRIPKELSDDEKIDLSKEINIWEDFGCSFNNKRTKSERKLDFQRAMYIEGMIRFINIYAQSEIGSNYEADIKKVALYCNKCDFKCKKMFKNKNEMYLLLENDIIDNIISVDDFICRKSY